MKKRLLALTLAVVAGMTLAVSAYATEETEGTGNSETTEATDGQHSEGDQTLVEHTECFEGDPEHIIYATCEESGIDRYACAVTPGQWHEVVVPAYGHAWASEAEPEGENEEQPSWGRVTVQPTCTSQGQAIDYCLNCGEEREVYRTIETLPHIFEKKVVDVKANCDHGGKYHFECIYCGTPELDEKGGILYTEIPMIEDYHDIYNTWDKWVTEKAPTCAEEGLKVRWCKICGDKEEEAIPVLEPNFVQTDYQVLDCYHAQITLTCSYCDGEVEGHQEVLEKDIVSHVFELTDDYILKQVDPSCEEDGYIIYKCKYFDAVDGHEEPAEDDDEATMYQKGTKKVVQLALGHDWTDWIERYAADEQGNEYGYYLRTCKRCNKTQELISKDVPEGFGKNGWVNENGTISYYKNDAVQTDMTGIYEYNDGFFFVTEGVIDTGANGLNLADGTWYFLANGQIQYGYDGFAEYDNNWFMLSNGMLDTEANGLYAYDGGTFMFAAGKLRTDYSGLWQNMDGNWYYLADGQVVAYTGVVEYDGAFFYVMNGQLASSFNGSVEYDGATFKVVNGQLYAA